MLSSADKDLLVSSNPEEFRTSFGEGLVQAEGAYIALMQNPSPCGGPIDQSGTKEPPVEIFIEYPVNNTVQQGNGPQPILLQWNSDEWYEQQGNNEIQLFAESEEVPTSTGRLFDNPDDFGTPTTGFIEILSIPDPNAGDQEETDADRERESPALTPINISVQNPEFSTPIHSDNGETPDVPPIDNQESLEVTAISEPVGPEQSPPSENATPGYFRHWEDWENDFKRESAPVSEPEPPTTPEATTSNNGPWRTSWRWVSGGDRRKLRVRSHNSKLFPTR